jgi:peptidoglycan/LPS O-acetylase OafA/YrhL
MERVSAQRPELDTSKLDRSEIIGMVAAAVLVISLFLQWYSLSTDPSVVQRGTDPANWACGVGESSCSGWETFPILRWLLLAAAAAPFILAWILIRGHALSWPRGELTAIVGATAFVLIAYNGIVSKPQNGLEISLGIGYWLALLACVGIFISGGFRAVESGGGARRKPPATF